MARVKRGLVQVYTGDGKGKTTAALGLAMRAAGQGLRVGFIQFLKGKRGGEHFFASRYQPFEIVQVSSDNHFTRDPQVLGEEVRQTLALAEERMLGGDCDLLILDEVLVAVHTGFIASRQVLDLIDRKPGPLDLVLTGRNAPPEIIDRADLVTEMRLIKHPFQQRIGARRGIEY
ncbi:MAG: cob(I)yrinic acid a,c-diamide adenosyltransferase [Chloroflexi bacterium]|nr:cob(I)yrinic acid a,c-diamide adenosyltransferase [Chloroflexota bacterium]